MARAIEPMVSILMFMENSSDLRGRKLATFLETPDDMEKFPSKSAAREKLRCESTSI
jgi:hypothetical protein